MIVYVFDVDHGFAGLVMSPNGYGLMIDCGRRSDGFSPAKWIAQNLSLRQFQGKQLAGLVISHPHRDHVEDIGNLVYWLPPAILWRYKYNWHEVPDGPPSKEFEQYRDWQERYNQEVLSYPDWGMTLSVHGLPGDAAKELNATSFVNNSSRVVVLSLRQGGHNWRFIFPGDIETDGWERLLEEPGFLSEIRQPAATVLITSHHGHSSGYSQLLFDSLGALPVVNVVSAKAGDDDVDPRYSQQASGVVFNRELRRTLTTRTDGTLRFQISSDGSCRIDSLRLPPNDA